jgi:hypothetical protein
MTITVHDDSGAIQETLVIPAVEVDDFVDQLPEGWYIEILDEEGE